MNLCLSRSFCRNFILLQHFLNFALLFRHLLFPKFNLSLFSKLSTMPSKMPTLNSLILSLLLLSFILATHSQPSNSVDDDDQEFQQLLSIDDEQETQQIPTATDSNEMRKAQRIVVELNNDNTQKIIHQNEQVLILGYTPWCPKSAELMPHFARASNLLREVGSTLLMAKLDAERFPQTASSLGIKGYPTLLLFTNGSSQPYTGGFTAEELVIWARKKTGEPVIILNSVAEAEAFAKKYPMFVLGHFEKFEGPDHEEFVSAATADNEIQFVETNSIEVAEYLYPGSKSTKPFIGLVKSEPERYTSFGESLKMEKILHFVNFNRFPLVITLSELNSIKVYSSPFNLQVYVIAESDEFMSLLQPLQEIAKKFKSQILFIYVDITEDNLSKPFLTLLGLEDAKKTVVAAFDNKIISKHLLDSEPVPSKIEEFCTGLLHGKVPIYYKSQPIPDNTNASVLVVVGKTLDDLVFSSSKNILLEVHTPWCMTCETTSKQVEKLAKHFKGMENLIFVKYDASANEHPKLQITDYPTLLFYPASDKSNPVKLSTKSKLKDLAAVIKKNVKDKDQIARDEL